MFNNLDIRIIDEPKNVYFPLERKVLFEKIDLNSKYHTFLPGNKLWALRLNVLELHQYTISHFTEPSKFSSIKENQSIYFFNKKGERTELYSKFSSLLNSLQTNTYSSIYGFGEVRFFWDERSCYDYLLKIGIPKILKDSEYYFSKKDRNLSHDKFEYKKTFYKRAKMAKKELEKYFKNNP